jgi:hypothetical protein
LPDPPEPGKSTNFSISWFNPSTEFLIGFIWRQVRGDGIKTGFAIAGIMMKNKNYYSEKSSDIKIPENSP